MKPKRALKSTQLWTPFIKPLSRLRERLRQLEARDPELAAIAKDLEATQQKFWAIRAKRQLAEAKAKDKGQVLWELFCPRGSTIYDRQLIVLRTPHTMQRRNEYWSIPDGPPSIVGAESAYRDLEKELAKAPFDPMKFREHAAKVDAQYKRWRSEGGPEKEQEAA